MEHYYVNKIAQPNGDHEVHIFGCNYLPSSEHRQYLGYFATCSEALEEAKKTNPLSDGCFYCCKACHMR